MHNVVKRNFQKELSEMTTERTGEPAGSNKWLAGYTTTVVEFMKKFSEEELDEFTRQAEQWNEDGPPDQVKQECVSSLLII
jgi:hypothetical protein